LLKLHEEMEEMGKDSDFEMSLQRQQKNLERVRMKMRELKPSRDRYQRVVEMQGRIYLLEMKLKQLDYETKLAELRDAEIEKRMADQALQEAKERLNPLESKLDRDKAAKRRVDEGLKMMVGLLAWAV